MSSSTHRFSIGSAPALLCVSRRWREVNSGHKKWIIKANFSKYSLKEKEKKSSYEPYGLLSRVHIFVVLF